VRLRAVGNFFAFAADERAICVTNLAELNLRLDWIVLERLVGGCGWVEGVVEWELTSEGFDVAVWEGKVGR
jgi:hypothetical protein